MVEVMMAMINGTSKNMAKEMARKRDRTPPRELQSDPPL